MARWIDYEPYSKKSMTVYRARREMCGISLYDATEGLGVAANTVKRWENPNCFPPSPDAWRYTDCQYKKRRDRVADALRKALDTRMERQPIITPWHRNDMSGASDMQVGTSNAASPSVAEALMAFGCGAAFCWPDPDVEESQRETTSDYYRRAEQNPNT